MWHAVIMAGGSGTRLWPLSRPARPKQLLRLFKGESLLRRSFDRLAGLLPPERIHVIANGDYAAVMRAELPELPAENFMAEPCARDTANAVGLAAHLLAAKDPAGTMGIFTADHIIEPVDLFRETVRRGFETADHHPDALVTFGVVPRSAHTGYGYVRRGRQIAAGVHEVLQFKEKPDRATAEAYLASGEYYWNSGMFAWRIATVIEQIRRWQPATHEGLRDVVAQFRQPGIAAAIRERFGTLPRISVDYAILEKADRVLAVEMNCRWLDVGSWTALAEVFEPDATGNTVAAPNVRTLDARDNIFVSEGGHLIAAIGVRDLMVVHADDATLICRREDAQRIKEMVEMLSGATGGAPAPVIQG
ncbi:MAG TPA: mannose-1-phosphate guanylyltransferase [Phycisphaerae bacterium]|nr:mannose-1-phosphate guanylyltransferase [Phycisphaerae bacterium]HRY69959.1 mannose-1-phosphate guanylyltransferase [Phycisphaerae bacterium]HSA27168.1 mannose-1-phosphate guanylyltransferase [Phycisphaerae bacterium]